MGTITINVNNEIEKRFRATVKKTIGTGKGKLGSAVTQAMQKWIEEKEQRDISYKELSVLATGYKMGKLLYKKREELYGR